MKFSEDEESGRAFIQRFPRRSKSNLQYKCVFSDYITADFPLIGIEPSILTFRDEYIRLADDTESAKIS
jgi:hypothetical protein